MSARKRRSNGSGGGGGGPAAGKDAVDENRDGGNEVNSASTGPPPSSSSPAAPSGSSSVAATSTTARAAEDVPGTFDPLAGLFDDRPVRGAGEASSSSAAKRRRHSPDAPSRGMMDIHHRADDNADDGSSIAPFDLVDEMMARLRDKFAQSDRNVAKLRLECKSLTASLAVKTHESGSLGSAHAAQHTLSMLVSHCVRYNKWMELDSLAEELRPILDRHQRALKPLTASAPTTAPGTAAAAASTSAK